MRRKKDWQDYDREPQEALCGKSHDNQGSALSKTLGKPGRQQLSKGTKQSGQGGEKPTSPTVALRKRA